MKNNINFKELSKNAMDYSKQKFNDTKKFASEKAIPKIKETALTTKQTVSETTKKVSDKVKTVITEEQLFEILDNLYNKSVNGIPSVSPPVDDLINDYMSKNDDIDKAVKSLINNSTVKCGTSGFITSLGGILTLPISMPANVTSVMYVQLRMCCAIAKMGGYDVKSDQVQTLVYACLTGSAVSDILKSSGVKFANKITTALIKKIPGSVLKSINNKIGVKLLTKFGSQGVINLVDVVPVVGGLVGGGIDVASTRIIGKNAYRLFIKGEMPSKEKEENVIIRDAEYEELDDIDTKTFNERINKK